MPSAGKASATSSSAASARRDPRPREHAVEDPAPRARPPAAAVAQAAEDRHAALLRPALLAQPGQHRRQERQRADHRDGDDDHRADAEGDEDRRARQQHARHRDEHDEARHDDRVARGRGGGFQRGLRALALVALLHLAAHVEHRVVDADGEADEQDDRADLVGDRRELADRADQPERRADGGHAEQQRQARRRRARRRRQQDDQRQRDRQRLRALEVVAHRLVERLLRRGRADLLDAQVGVVALHRGGRGERRVDAIDGLLVVAGDLERQQRRAAVLRHLAGRGRRRTARRPSRRAATSFSRCVELGRGRSELGAASRAGSTRLQQHLLAAGLAEAGACSTARSAARDEPLPISASLSEFVPIMPPPTVATTTNAIQPRIAILRCCALQRPARAARFVGLMTAPVVVVIVRSLSSAEGASRCGGRANRGGAIPPAPGRATTRATPRSPRRRAARRRAPPRRAPSSRSSRPRTGPR